MIAALLAWALALGGQAAPSPSPTRLAAGTPLVLRTTAPLSSRRTIKGDRVALALAEPVTHDGRILAAAGTPAVGEVTRVEPKAAFGAAGRIEARLLYLLVDGRPVRIAGRLGEHGRAATAASVATGVMFNALAFVVTGRSAEIPAGTRVEAEVVSDTALAR